MSIAARNHIGVPEAALLPDGGGEQAMPFSTEQLQLLQSTNQELVNYGSNVGDYVKYKRQKIEVDQEEVGVIKVKTEAESAYLDVKQKNVELEAQRITYKERETELKEKETEIDLMKKEKETEIDLKKKEKETEIDLKKKEKETEIDLKKKEKETELKEQEVELKEREADLEVRKRENNMKLMIEEAEVRMRCKMIEQGLPDPVIGSSVQVQGQGGVGQVQGQVGQEQARQGQARQGQARQGQARQGQARQGQTRTRVRRNRRSNESYERMSLYPSSDSSDDEYDESIDNVNRCRQFLGRYDIAITKFYIPKYMEQGFKKSESMLKYEEVLDERIQRYEKLLDDPPAEAGKHCKAGYRQQLKASIERERHYVQCLFLAACRHLVDPVMWREVVGDCFIANHVYDDFFEADWKFMDYDLFGFDVTKAAGSQLENSLETSTAFNDLQARSKTSTEVNFSTKINDAKFRFSMSVVNHLCETMKIRLKPYQTSYD
jgi:hypothetical protein